MTTARLAFAIAILAAQTGWASTSLKDVEVARQGDALVLSLVCSEAVAAEAVSKKLLSKGSVVELHLKGVATKKRWLKASDPLLKRVLIKPSKGAAVLRMRFKGNVPTPVFDGIKIEVDGPKVLAKLPLDAETAAAWAAVAGGAAGAAAVGAVAAVKAEPAAAGGALAAAGAGLAAQALGGEKSAPAARSEPTPAGPRADPTDSVQAGIQSITDRIAAALEAQDPSGFRRVAVLPFKGLDQDVTEHNLDRISTELMSVRLAARPRILQVERARLDGVVSELKRSKRGELSPKGAASVGKLLGANSVVLGSVGIAGANYVVTARAVDAESGQVLAAADHDFTRSGMVAFSEDVVEIKSRFGAAARSAGLPGWGQIYNGDTGRGVVYMSLFGATAAGAIASAVLGVQAENDYKDTTDSDEAVELRESANDHYTRTNIMLISLGAVWATAVVDAYLTGVDAQNINVGAASDGETTALTLRAIF